MDDHLQRIVNGRQARDPVLPKLPPVRLMLLKPLYFDGELVAAGETVVVDGYDAPVMIARGVARVS